VPIEIHPYNPEWPRRYQLLAKGVRRALGPFALRVEHIGSTAVPGLAGKDIIDIQVSVTSFYPESNYRAPLERTGYTYRPDDDLDHRFFKQDSAAGRRLANLHLCEVGSARETRHLLFRDILRSDRQTAKEYELLKTRLSAKHEDVLSYTNAKTAFIAEVLAGSQPTRGQQRAPHARR
jgi:GrpB-like predicted nucleotidyltransferase (UPF0157 family)